MDVALEAGPDADVSPAGTGPATAPGATPAAGTDDPATDLEQLSDDDVEALLLAKLNQIEEGRQG
ncbi:hypothetical protein MCBG_00132 [Micromonospora sp. M42]|nr:hypothetical protein [Micromonospora sp. M42]EWM62999.1 hypothetical protein MCBG_00132 [Micromonospora sp. M42]